MVRAAINKVNQTTSQKDKIEWMNPFIVSDSNFSGFAAFVRIPMEWQFV